MSVLPPDPVFTLQAAEPSPIHSICFNCNGDNQTLLAGTEDGKVYTWDLATNRVHHKFSAADGPILNLQHTRTRLYTQDKQGKIKIWNRSETDYVLERSFATEYCGFCRFHLPDSADLLVGPEDNSKFNLYTREGTVIATMSPDPSKKLGQVMCFKFLDVAGGQYVLAAYESGDLFLWDLKMQKPIGELKLNEFPLSVDYDLVSNRGIYGCSSENIQVFSVSKSDFKMSLKCDIVLKNPGVNVLRIKHDRKVFASGGWDGKLRIYSWKTLRPLAVLTEHKKPLQDVCYSRETISLWNSPIMAAAGLDCTISLWDIYNR